MSGSTREWRRLRAVVLDRDGYRCKRPVVRAGIEVECGEPANHAGHIVARVLGGTDTLDNLRAECAPCNLADGPALAELSKTTKGWTW